MLLLATSCGQTPLFVSGSRQAGGAGAGGAIAQGGSGGLPGTGGGASTGGTLGQGSAQGGAAGVGGANGAGGVLGTGGTVTTVPGSSVCCKALYCPSGDAMVTTCPAGAFCYEYTACGCNQVLCARADGSDGSVGTGGSNSTGGATGTGGGTTVDHYVVSADGLTVTDTRTGLVWQRDGSGSRPNCVENPYCMWPEAQAYCAGLTLDGSGWRLPTLTELPSIADFTVAGPAINQIAFPNTPAEVFWTSSPYAGSSGYAWLGSFNYGGAESADVSNSYRVRCVR